MKTKIDAPHSTKYLSLRNEIFNPKPYSTLNIQWQQAYRSIADLNLLELITVFVSAVYLITCAALSCLAAAGLVAVVRPGRQQQGGRSSARAQTQSNCGCHGLRSSARQRRCEHQPAGTGQPQPELTSSTVSDTQYQCGGAGGGGQLVQCAVEAVVMLWGLRLQLCVVWRWRGRAAARPAAPLSSASLAAAGRRWAAGLRSCGNCERRLGLGWPQHWRGHTGNWDLARAADHHPARTLHIAPFGAAGGDKCQISGKNWGAMTRMLAILTLSEWQFKHWKEYPAISKRFESLSALNASMLSYTLSGDILEKPF